MKNVEVEFTIKIDKNIYQSTACTTKESFFEEFVLSHIAHDYNMINNALKDKEDIEKYKPYLETLKNVKNSIINSVTYELVNTQNNIEQVKINCAFNYYENTICDLEKTVETEIFTTNIRHCNFLVKDIPRLIRRQYDDKEKEIAHAVGIYQHIEDLLKEAKNTVLINKKPVQFELVD